MSGCDKNYNQIIKKKKRMGQSKIKKERDYKYTTKNTGVLASEFSNGIIRC